MKNGTKCPKEMPLELQVMQVAIYVMCGGGFTGGAAVRAPVQFYVDTRASGTFPYSDADLMSAVTAYEIRARELGYNTNSMPDGDCLQVLSNMGGAL